MNLIDYLKVILVLIGLGYTVRIPYLLLFAQYVTGYEMSEIHHMGMKMDIERGTPTFWGHCIRHMVISAIVAASCYVVITYQL